MHRAISGDDMVSVRWGSAVDEARMAINALRRAVHAAEHGDPDAVRDADDDLMCVGYEDLIKRLAEEAEDYMH